MSPTTIEPRLPGLRFEVFQRDQWHWQLVGKDGVVCQSPDQGFPSDVEARAHIAKNKGRLKAASYAKVLNVESESR